MKVKVRKVGNSLTLTIPRDLSEKLGLTTKSEVDIGLSGEKIEVKPIKTIWEMLLEETRKKVKEMGISEEDVLKAISELRYGN